MEQSTRKGKESKDSQRSITCHCLEIFKKDPQQVRRKHAIRKRRQNQTFKTKMHQWLLNLQIGQNQ